MTRLAEMFNVNHFIVSQVNPHVVPFLEKEPIEPTHYESSESRNGYEGWKSTFVSLAMGEALHRMNVLAEMGIFTTSLTKAKSVLSQKYAGDITIFPEVPLVDLQKLIKNPTPEFMIEAGLRGERATWPRMSRIRNCCAIELALDKCIHQLRTKVVFSGSQVDLRLNTLDINKNSEKTAINRVLSSHGRVSNSSRKRPASGDPVELSTFYPPAPGPPVASSFEGQSQNRLSYPPVTTRGRSHSTGPPQLPQFSPALSRSLGMGKGYFDPSSTRTPGSPNSSKSIHSMNSGKAVTIRSPKPASSSSSSNRSSAHIGSPVASRPPNDEIGGYTLRRTGSRYRLVRQTPSSELDPADAEDESAAIAGSSEDEDPFQLPASLDDHGDDDDEPQGYLPDQPDDTASSSFAFSVQPEENISNDPPISLQRRPFASRSATALPFHTTYLPNDEVYSSRATYSSQPGSAAESPIATTSNQQRATSSNSTGRFDDPSDESDA